MQYNHTAAFQWRHSNGIHSSLSHTHTQALLTELWAALCSLHLGWTVVVTLLSLSPLYSAKSHKLQCRWLSGAPISVTCWRAYSPNARGKICVFSVCHCVITALPIRLWLAYIMANAQQCLKMVSRWWNLNDISETGMSKVLRLF